MTPSAAALLAGLALAFAGAAQAQGLNLSTGTDIAVQAAKEAKAAPTVATNPDATVQPSTVKAQDQAPATPTRTMVVASTDAAPLASPDYTAKDAKEAPPSVALGDNTSLGKNTIDNRPQVGGLLGANPDILGDATRGNLGVSAKF